MKVLSHPAGWPCEIWLKRGFNVISQGERYFTGLAPSPPAGGSALLSLREGVKAQNIQILHPSPNV
jgi:hypothetical protein